MRRVRPPNAEIAELLGRVADLLEAQDANAYRVRAYHGAAATAREHDRPIVDVLEEEGRPGLVALPSIGESISRAIEEYVDTGHLRLLERLEGQVTAEGLFTTVPGIGDDLAHRIHETLGVETLEDLELAAHDGRLEGVPGFGPRRTRGVREALASILAQSGRRRARGVEAAGPGTPLPFPVAPSVPVLLDVDAEYRARATRGTLRRIAPRRFNPEGRVWLPILHTEGGGWSFTAMFSNTARAHRLGTTHDWVMVFYEREGIEGRATIVTEHQGPLRDRRVVRGRETECARFYEARHATDDVSRTDSSGE